MRTRTLGLLAACLLPATLARAGDIYYGTHPADPSLTQVIRMDEDGANKAALFPPGVLDVGDPYGAEISHANYATAFAQGRMWLCVPNGPTFPNGVAYNDAYVFARSPAGQLAYRQVTDLLGAGLYVDYNNSGWPRWAVDDGFVSCQVEDPGRQVSYLVRIAVTGAQVAADGYVPIPFFDPANPGALDPRIEVLLVVPWQVTQDGRGYPRAAHHTWNFEGTRLAYSSDVGWRVKTVGPLGRFAGSTNPALDPVLLNLNAFVAYVPLQWRPVAGSDQIIARGGESTKSGTKYGLYYAYANTLTHTLFLANGTYDSKTHRYSNYLDARWTADGGTVVVQDDGDPKNPYTYYIRKVPAAGGTLTTLASSSGTDSTAALQLYGAR